MRKRKRDDCKTRITARSLRETLNRIIELFNQTLTPASHIQPVVTPRDLFAVQKQIECLHTTPNKPDQSVAPPNDHSPENIIPQALAKGIAELATNAWRAKRKMIDPDTGQPNPSMKGVLRHIEAQFRELEQLGVEVRDMQGRPYDTGMLLHVVTFEPSKGLNREEIIETIRPTIAWNQKVIQIAEVIVGTPE